MVFILEDEALPQQLHTTTAAQLGEEPRIMWIRLWRRLGNVSDVHVEAAHQKARSKRSKPE